MNSLGLGHDFFVGAARNFPTRYFLVAPLKLRKEFFRHGEKRSVQTFPKCLSQIGPLLVGKGQRQFLDLCGAHQGKVNPTKEGVNREFPRDCPCLIP